MITLAVIGWCMSLAFGLLLLCWGLGPFGLWLLDHPVVSDRPDE